MARAPIGVLGTALFDNNFVVEVRSCRVIDSAQRSDEGRSINPGFAAERRLPVSCAVLIFRISTN